MASKNSKVGEALPGQNDSSSDIEKENIDVEKAGAPMQEEEGQQKQDSPQRELATKQEKDPNLIDWDGPDDPGHPHNWPIWKRWRYTLLLGSTTFVVTFSSSVFSTAVVPTAMEFHVSEEVMVLGTSLFVLGFAFGPPVFGPLSELYGRKYPLFLGYAAFAIFNIPVGVAQNLQTIFICRFFGGFFASAPLGIIAGMLADLWDPVNRGVAMCVFAGATFIGPVTGPIVGGFITQSYLGWRWTAWITLIMAAWFGTIAFLVVPETSAPIILHRRAKKIRYETRNWAIHSKHDETNINAKVIAEKYLFRPFKMLMLEPILVLISIYIGFIYGIIYLFFESFPVSFIEERGWNLGVGALPFIAVGLGVICGAGMIVVNTKTRFVKRMKQEGRVIPEERLPAMIVGGALLPLGLFWYAWTSSPNISPWPQIIACVPIGAGVMSIFMQGLTYLIDVYTIHANSAIAANALFRSFLGAGFPMFATGMYHNLGVPWATSTLAFISVGLFPVPVLFFIFGARIRSWSRYSVSAN